MTFDYNPTPPAIIKNYKELRLKVPTDFYFISILRPIVALNKLKFPLRDNNIFYFLFQILNNFCVLLVSVQQQEEPVSVQLGWEKLRRLHGRGGQALVLLLLLLLSSAGDQHLIHVGGGKADVLVLLLLFLSSVGDQDSFNVGGRSPSSLREISTGKLANQSSGRESFHICLKICGDGVWERRMPNFLATRILISLSSHRTSAD